MEVSFTAKPQSLTLSSGAPLSPTKLRLLRREFLGSSHKLRRPGGLRSRRKCRKLSLLQLQSPPSFLVRASLGPNSALVVVVAVVTLSAICVYYFNQYARKKKNAKQVSSTPNLGPPQTGRDVLKDLSSSQIIVNQSITKKKSVKTNESEESDQNLVERELQPVLQFGESASVGEETYASSQGSHQTSNVVTSVVDDSTIDGIKVFPCLTVTPKSDALTQQMAANEQMESLLGVKKTEVESDHEILGKSQHAATDVPTSVGKHDHVEASTKGETTGHNSFHEESVRAELYTFYESQQSEAEQTKASSPSTVVNGNVNGNGLSSLMRHSMFKGYKLSTDEHSNGNVQNNAVVSLNKIGSSRKRKGTGKGSGILTGKERKYLPQNNFENPSQLYESNGALDTEHWAAEQISTYNHLLRRGRVRECVKLLEDMEAVDLLDMNKVYHSRFYGTCKSRKAVEEAFSFTKLISNPTLSTFNMLMSVCANSQDSEAAFRVLRHVEEAGLKADCKLYTTLISTCAKCGKVDRMFEVFHEMVNAGVEPNVHTYGALIDGCARAGQVAKAFGAYGIMRSKNVKPDRVVFNALITACGQAGAVDRAFDVLAEMRAEIHPIDPDHITVGALIKACSHAGQVDRAKEVYKMMDEYNIKGTPEVYTIAVNCCSLTGDWEFAMTVYNDMIKKDVAPDEMFLSALIDVAGHAGNVDAAFEAVNKARKDGMHLGIISYSSLMGACSNAKSWEKALEVYEDMKSIKMKPTISTMNALITALCDGDQLPKAMDILRDMTTFGLCPNAITYSILLVASEKKDDVEAGITLFSQAKEDGVAPNITMCNCLIGMCLRRYERACALGEPVSSVNMGWPQINSKWTSLALTVYRETIAAGITPTNEVVSQILGCLHFPYDISLRDKIIENLGVSADTSRYSNLCSLVEGFGEYDPRAFSLLEEAASLKIVPCVSFKQSPLVIDAKAMQIHTAQVYILTVLRGLKHRLAAGAKLPNITILLPVEKTQIASPHGEKTINVAGRISQAVAALLRRMRLPYQGNESYGKIRINGLALSRWFRPKLASPFSGKHGEFGSPLSRIGKGIAHQQRNIRTGNLSLD
ncbi:hypothetical protein CDL15_Pgr019633 [Punica granatum]|uniref:PROP1-like PPR domain-containing protein n=2 Tax=Punica granatum TaxID=22663 RepID=A0A218X603_PUNGR|nr:hypothetical protein CDL15_Pgr019633 [Punica granatum]